MVGHIGADDRIFLPQIQVGRRKVNRLVEAIPPNGVEPFELFNILHHLTRAEGQRQQRGIGGNDQIIGKAPFKAQARCTKGAILIVHRRIKGIEARFGDAPRHPFLATIGDLLINDGQTTLEEQRIGIGVQQQGRHQILEHRPTPGEQRLFAARYLGEWTGQV